MSLLVSSGRLLVVGRVTSLGNFFLMHRLHSFFFFFFSKAMISVHPTIVVVVRCMYIVMEEFLPTGREPFAATQ